MANGYSRSKEKMNRHVFSKPKKIQGQSVQWVTSSYQTRSNWKKTC